MLEIRGGMWELSWDLSTNITKLLQKNFKKISKKITFYVDKTPKILYNIGSEIILLDNCNNR